MCLSGKGIESPSQGQLSAARRATLRCLHSTTRPPQPAVIMQHRRPVTAVLDAVLPTTAGVLCIESQAELTLVLAMASGPILQTATRRLRAVLVAAVSSRARCTGGTQRFYCPTPVQ